ncbi:MAG: putative replication initiation protein [Herbinix sp.]|nr:putative replication initiation protein [Herbinix sp.]
MSEYGKLTLNINNSQHATFEKPLYLIPPYHISTMNKGGYHPSTTPNNPVYRSQNLSAQKKRICNEVCNLVINNSFNSLYVTLTFADSNRTDLKECRNLLTKFLSIIKVHYVDFAYVGVVAIQKRDTVHYHFIANLPPDSLMYLREWWHHGLMKVKRTCHVYGIANHFRKNLKVAFSTVKLPSITPFTLNPYT